jgi:RNA ligase (TIGR02306 family)
VLGIQKWEPEVAASMRGTIRGNFPSWLRKTDQERIQNCYKDVSKKFDSYWIGEEKLDGSSMTVGILDGEVHVCSRNLSIKLDDIENTFVKTALSTNVINALMSYGKNIALSGELIGPGIQGNKYALSAHQWHIFDVYDVDTARYMTPFEREGVLTDLMTMHGLTVKKVPYVTGGSLTGMTVDELLNHAEGVSALNNKTQREGIVWKCLDDGDLSFKAISNAWLIKNKE